MKTMFRIAGVLGVAFLLVGAAFPALAETQLLLKTDGPWVKGESKVKGYENWILAGSFGYEVTNLTGANPDTGYISVIKGLDRASVELAFHAVDGTVFDEVTFEVLGNYGTQLLTEFRVRLLLTRITLIRPSLRKNGDVEEVIFDNYSQIEWTYYRRNAAGNLLGTVTRTVPGT